MCTCISTLPRERGFLQHDSGSAGPQSCLSHVPGVAMATEDCKTDTHTCAHIHTQAKHILSLSRCLFFSPHTHTHTFTQRSSSSTMQQEYRRTCLHELRRGITQHWQNTEDARREEREERTAGRERASKRVRESAHWGAESHHHLL